jgi:hypothetical protein
MPKCPKPFKKLPSCAYLDLDDDLRLVGVVAADAAPVLGQHRQHVPVLGLAVERVADADDAGVAVNAEPGAEADDVVQDAAVGALVEVGRLHLADHVVDLGRLGDGELEPNLLISFGRNLWGKLTIIK